MYMTCGISCADCARAIISAGIKKVVFRSTSVSANSAKWQESAKRSNQMFKEAGIEIEYYD
jgi:deoxycytidylate deaminase